MIVFIPLPGKPQLQMKEKVVCFWKKTQVNCWILLSLLFTVLCMHSCSDFTLSCYTHGQGHHFTVIVLFNTGNSVYALYV